MSGRRYSGCRKLGKSASNGDGASAPSLLRGRGERRAAEGRRGGRKRGRSEATRSDARGQGVGKSRRRWERSDRATVAVTHGFTVRTCKRSAQRARASEGARDRHPKGEDRVSGLRGAGRGEAAPGGIEPGDRSEGPGGRPYVPAGRANDNEPSLTTERDDPQVEEIEGSSNRAPRDRLLAARDALMAKGKPDGVDDRRRDEDG